MDSRPFSISSRFRSFRFAFAGIKDFFAAQHNAIIHLLATIAVLAAMFFFDLSGAEKIALVLSIGFVWAAEFFNTAIEKLCDLYSTDFHPAIKMIKDVAAAAVLIAAAAAVITGCIIFLPKIF
jgi:diacylglycerol kinase (ATP)